MAVFLGGAPARFVEEHEENVAFLFCVDVVELFVEVIELEQAFGNKVVFDALVLKVSVHGFNECKIVESETHELVRSLVLIKSYD